MIRFASGVLLSAFALFLSGCNGKFNGVTVVGSGVVERETRDVKEFKELSVAGSGELIIRQGEEDRVTIETDDNLIPLIRTDSKKGKLQIRIENGYSLTPSQPIRIEVTCKSLKDLTLLGSSDLDLDDYEAKELTITLSGSSKAVVSRSKVKNLSIKVNGSGTIEADGQCDSLDIGVAGSGKIKAYDLNAGTVKISISGSGNAEVTANNTLTVSVAGSGDVFYHGNADVKKSISGSGTVKKTD